MNNVKTLGQVFTPPHIVKQMYALRRNEGSILEPSCGLGAFTHDFPNAAHRAIAIELDKSKAPNYSIIDDFFNYELSNKFNTIIGNPPYVKFGDIKESTKQLLDLSLFDKRTNLYMFFIKKCIDHLEPHGELIFITPKEFLKSTNCLRLNQYIYERGTITDLIDFGDEVIFPTYSPNCIVFRFEKDNFTRTTNASLSFQNMNGQLIFTSGNNTINFNDIFFVKVGAVSGADSVYVNPKGNKFFVTSKTLETGKTKRAYYDIKNSYLLSHKEELLNRRIRTFDDSNWWEWGRNLYDSPMPRIYVNCKTRRDNPFFTHKCRNYMGSILGVFFKNNENNSRIQEAINDLNNVDWEDLGFKTGGRFIFSQRSLENCLLPDEFKKYLC